MRRLRRDERVDLGRHSFAVFVEESLDVEGTWVAHIVGHGLDNVTQGDSPEMALYMAYDLLKTLTGFCSDGHPEHDWSIRGGLREWMAPYDDSSWIDVGDSYTCSRCGESVRGSCLEEVSDDP